MIFGKALLLFIASLIGFACSAPIYARPPDIADSTLELTTRAQHIKRPKFSIKHAGDAIIFKHRISKAFHPGPSTSVFWSGSVTKANGKSKTVSPQAQRFAKQHKLPKKTINQALDEADIKIPTAKQNPHSTHIWGHASREWAKSAHGDVDVVVGTVVRPDSVYKQIEQPILMKNDKVTSIVEHTAGTHKKTVIKGPHVPGH